MARKKLTEYAAKKILYPALSLQLVGSSVDVQNASLSMGNLSDSIPYVAKVDQGIKKRMKKGLVKVGLSKSEVENFISETAKQGFFHFFVEKFIEHDVKEEKYLSLERTREGIDVFYSNSGGIHVEDKKSSIQKIIVKNAESLNEIKEVETYLSLPENTLKKIIQVFDDAFFSFLEINPLVIRNGKVHILDLAVEVDSAAEFFVNKAWSAKDFTDVFSLHKTAEEKTVADLVKTSQAAFSLELLNENGSIFVLLSGGGASLVIADEVYSLGYGKELANYGEYSGNPNREETYIYTKAILRLLQRSKARRKLLIIGGGVANFTDIRITFKGVVKALDEVTDELKKEQLKIYVRRGGPHQEEGLEMMTQFLDRSKIAGEVYGPDIILTEVVKKGMMHD